MGVRPSRPAAAETGKGGFPADRSGLLSGPPGDGELLVVLGAGVVLLLGGGGEPGGRLGRGGLVAHAGDLGRVL